MLRPTAENFAVILLNPSVEEGIEVLAPAWFAVLLSLLPSKTFHEGPPACTKQSLRKKERNTFEMCKIKLFR